MSRNPPRFPNLRWDMQEPLFTFEFWAASMSFHPFFRNFLFSYNEGQTKLQEGEKKPKGEQSFFTSVSHPSSLCQGAEGH